MSFPGRRKSTYRHPEEESTEVSGVGVSQETLARGAGIRRWHYKLHSRFWDLS